ncbi:hypothetical protein FHS83_000051 [Rhizomicrobium palustre]|uniref:Glycosyltransferase subfamily 4-like N-terminal domain-containing protein n=1 Tax=Rhizomicrobium palustre TaxID=189966 RepID=A0A846MTQ3_9PROT|nr:glycosyltransferase [Rhizomicrobium palustre]NIK86733.1 hypothetical protein [Rhizomicrobium palustre]
MPNLLILSYAFQPDNTPAAARPSQLFRYLAEEGVTPFVLASSSDGGRNDEPQVIRTPGLHEPLSRHGAAFAARGFMRFFAPYNDRLPWVPFAVAAAKKIIRENAIDAIYSTSPFLASHFAAAWLKREFGLPWIADFQDPVCDNPFRTRRWIYPYDRLIERTIFREADRLIANTDAIAQVWRTRYPDRANDIAVMWNSFDPEEPVERGRATHEGVATKILAHVGTLYGGRHPGQLLQSLKRLGSKEVQVRLTGPIDAAVLQAHGPIFAEMEREGALAVTNTLVPRDEALRRTAEADCLLLLDVNERNAAFQVPSKLLDYIRIGKPILAYTPAASPVDRILARSGIAYVAIAPDMSPAESDARLAQFLALPNSQNTPSQWFLENFSARTQAHSIAEMTCDILQHRSSVTSGPVVVAELTRPEAAPPVGLMPRLMDQRPLLVTTVDAEEEFDWQRPLSRDNRAVTAMSSQGVLQRIFERYGITPVYFVTYPIVTQAEGYRLLQDHVVAGRAEIGAQLHPWVTPPFEEEVTPFNSFAGNLPPQLEFSKIRVLTEAIASRFDRAPKAYRAGRYGIGPNTVMALSRLGYEIDSSVVPEFGYHAIGGPAFFGRPTRPYWLDSAGEILELPLTSAYIGRLTGETPSSRALAKGLFEDDERHALSRSLMARSGLMERIRLTPEGTKVSDAKRLVRALLKRGTRIFTLSFHSPSLVPGNTPYVRSAAELEKFLAWFEEFYAFFFAEIGGAPATTSQIYTLAKLNRSQKAALP